MCRAQFKDQHGKVTLALSSVNLAQIKAGFFLMVILQWLMWTPAVVTSFIDISESISWVALYAHVSLNVVYNVLMILLLVIQKKHMATEFENALVVIRKTNNNRTAEKIKAFERVRESYFEKNRTGVQTAGFFLIFTNIGQLAWPLYLWSTPYVIPIALALRTGNLTGIAKFKYDEHLRTFAMREEKKRIAVAMKDGQSAQSRDQEAPEPPSLPAASNTLNTFQSSADSAGASAMTLHVQSASSS